MEEAFTAIGIVGLIIVGIVIVLGFLGRVITDMYSH